MIEDIFLSYANNLLENNPQCFYNIIEQVKKNRDKIEIDESELNPIIEYIIKLSKLNASEDFLSCIEEHGSINHYNDRFKEELYYAAHAIAGERDRYYNYINILKKRKSSKEEFKELTEKNKSYWFECDLRNFISLYTGKDLCEELFLQKCYVCHQLNFRYCLLQIVQGKEYLEIDGFKDVMIWSEEISASKRNLSISEEEGKPFRQTLSTAQFVFPVFYEFANNPCGNSYHTFNNFIFSVASYSLTEFLLANDRRKLKFCPYCEMFFIAKDIKRKHCCYANDCIRKWERDKKKDQREKDPVKYI